MGNFVPVSHLYLMEGMSTMKTTGLGTALENLMGGGGSQDVALLGTLMGNLHGGSTRSATDVSFLHKVIGHLNHGGLGDQVASWVGTGSNDPVSGTQLARVLPDDALQKTADEHGLHREDAAQRLARTLPLAVDKLTPSGKIPQRGSIEDIANQQNATMS
ncbi:YidB family protein [Streptomyces sp. NPDC050658]|uniref:YidB family protein n=1 Tax=unclassified Streptomyces TaxID=2593676 RepID=UPI003416BF44